MGEMGWGYRLALAYVTPANRRCQIQTVQSPSNKGGIQYACNAVTTHALVTLCLKRTHAQCGWPQTLVCPGTVPIQTCRYYA